MNIIQTKELYKHFGGVAANDHLSLGIEKGKITSLIGPNGSGKTTFINLLTGLLNIDSGGVFIDGVNLEKFKAYDIFDLGLTRTFQNVRVFEQMSVLDNILVVLTERGVFRSLFERHRDFHNKQAEDVLKIVGLINKKNELAENLSYGQRKLLEIARALAIKADIYLLDEPFAGLFPEMVKVVKKVINELKRQGKTIVLVEHNMELVREVSDHVVVLDSGALLAEGVPDKVLELKSVIEAYLGK